MVNSGATHSQPHAKGRIRIQNRVLYLPSTPYTLLSSTNTSIHNLHDLVLLLQHILQRVATATTTITHTN